MSFIPCVEACKFQCDGICTLSDATNDGIFAPNNICLNFIPRSDEHRYGFSDGRDLNEL